MSVKLKVNLPPTVSASQINTHVECQARWALSRTNTHKAKTDTQFMDLGTLVHNSIHNYYRSIEADQVITKDFIKLHAQSAFMDVWISKKIPSLEARFNRSLANFVKFENMRLKTWPEYRPTRSEWQARKKWGDWTLNGIIDFYSAPAKTIIDWKTGSKAELSQSYIQQGEIYRLLGELYGVEIDTVLFMFVNIGEVLAIPPLNRDWLKRALDNMKDTVVRGEFKKNKLSYCSNCEDIYACDFSDTFLWDDLL